MTDKQIIVDIKASINKVKNIEKMYFSLLDKYKAKEQECEELKIYIESNEQQVKGVETLVMDNDRLINELDQLKAENDEYSFFIEKLCDYAGLECDSEEQAMRTLSNLASQINKARWIIDRYKQTLTEIKEIAKKQCVCGVDCIDMKQILQKISEVEDVRN